MRCVLPPQDPLVIDGRTFVHASIHKSELLWSIFPLTYLRDCKRVANWDLEEKLCYLNPSMTLRNVIFLGPSSNIYLLRLFFIRFRAMEKLDMFITWNDDPNILYSKLCTFSSSMMNNEIHYPLLFCAKVLSSLGGSKRFICLNPLVV